MKRMKRSALLATAALTAACVPLARPQVVPGTGSQAALSGPAAPAMPVQAAGAGLGTITIHVKWPYHAQTIPYAANELDFAVLPASGGATLSSAVVMLPAATASLTNIPGGGVVVQASAYMPPSALYNNNTRTLVASGSSPVTVIPNQHVAASVTLVDLRPPTITSIGPSTGSVGTVVSVFGSGFTGWGPATPSVALSGMPVTIVGSVNDNFLEFQVPQGAVSGPVTVKVDGLTGTSPSTFLVQ